MTHPLDLLAKDTIGHSAPMAVEIVRPKATWPDLLGTIVGSVLGMFFYAWLLMILIPQFTDWNPSYWQCTAGYIAARIVLPTSTSDYRIWTRSR